MIRVITQETLACVLATENIEEISCPYKHHVCKKQSTPLPDHDSVENLVNGFGNFLMIK